MIVKLIDVAKDSIILLTGTIIPEKMEMIGRILLNNVEVFNNFRAIVTVLNVIDDYGESHLTTYRQLINNVVNHNTEIYHLRDYVNRGWQFGTMDLEKTGYDYIKSNFKKSPILKLDFDMYLENKILDLNIDTVDVMIMPSIGYATVVEQYKYDVDKLLEYYNIIPPQSTIYLILNKLDYLYSSTDWLNKKYKEWILNPIGNGPHHIGIACEPLLQESFKRNNFRIKSMLSTESYKKLLEVIAEKRIVDPSAKNIFFSEVGICHLYDDNQIIINI